MGSGSPQAAAALPFEFGTKGRRPRSSCALTNVVMDDNSVSTAPARRDRTAMPTRVHRHPLTVLFSCPLAIAPMCAQASQTTIAINATIVEVQCTGEQRARIRACAVAQERYTTEPAKTTVSAPSARGSATKADAPYEIRLAPARSVLIKTVLY